MSLSASLPRLLPQDLKTPSTRGVCACSPDLRETATSRRGGEKKRSPEVAIDGMAWAFAGWHLGTNSAKGLVSPGLGQGQLLT